MAGPEFFTFGDGPDQVVIVAVAVLDDFVFVLEAVDAMDAADENTGEVGRQLSQGA